MTNKDQAIITKTINAELRRFKHHPNDTDDLRSSAWVRILTHFSKFDPARGKLNTWASHQAQGAFMDYRRANYAPRLKDRDKSKRYMDHHLQGQVVSENNDDQVLDIIDIKYSGCTMTDREQDIIKMWLDGHTMKHIADKYNVHESRISQIIMVLRNRIRDATQT